MIIPTFVLILAKNLHVVIDKYKITKKVTFYCVQLKIYLLLIPYWVLEEEGL